MSNKTKYYLQQTASHIILLFVTNSMIQAFLLQSGIAEEKVALYLTTMQIVNAAVTFLLTFFIDKIKSIMKVYSVLAFAQLALYLSLIYLCLNQWHSEGFKFFAVLAAGCISNIMAGINSVIGYKVPYHIINIDDYGAVSGKCGIISGSVSTAVSLILSFFQARFDYFKTILAFLIIGTCLMVFSFIIIKSYKPLSVELTAQRTKNRASINILTYKPFYILLLPNFLRAYCEGLIFAAMTMGALLGKTNSSSGAILTTITQMGQLLGCLIFTVIITRIRVGKIMLFSTIGIFAFSPFLFMGNTTFFYILYAFIYLFDIFVQYSVPVAVTKIVDYNAIGQYTTFRMLTHTLGMIAANATLVPLTRALGGPIVMTIAAVGMLAAGITYYSYMKKIKRG